MSKKILVAVLVLVAILLIVGQLEHRNAPTEQAMREDFRSSYLRPCDATVSDRLHYTDATSPKCYFFKDRR